MNPSPTSSPVAAFANLLPKLAALTFLVIWGMGGSEAPLSRLCVVFGALALFEALTAAALRKQSPLLAWEDMPMLIGRLLSPSALPLYALVGAGVIFLGGEAGPVRRMVANPPPDRNVASPRFPPTSTRNVNSTTPGGSNPGIANPRPAPPPGPSTAPGAQRPPFNNTGRPPFSPPQGAPRTAPTGPGSASSPTSSARLGGATLTPSPAAPATTPGTPPPASTPTPPAPTTQSTPPATQP